MPKGFPDKCICGDIRNILQAWKAAIRQPRAKPWVHKRKATLALKGRGPRPFRANALVSHAFPGRCPGLSHYGPSGLL